MIHQFKMQKKPNKNRDFLTHKQSKIFQAVTHAH